MRVRIVSGVVAGPGVIWNPGEEHEVTDLNFARQLITHNQAVAVDPLPDPGPLTTRGERTHRDPVPTHREPRGR